MKKLIFLVSIAVSLVISISCIIFFVTKNNDDYLDTNEYSIFTLAVENGYSNTFSEWESEIEDKIILFRMVDADIEWLNNYSWSNLYKVEDDNVSWYAEFVSGDIYSYTQWYTVYFETYCDNVIEPLIAEENTTIVQPIVPTKDGYELLGWVYAGGANFFKFNEDKITQTTILEAAWIDDGSEKYTITYYLNGGENSTSNLNVYTENTKFTFNDAIYIGYEFLGWYSDSNYLNQITELNNTTGNLELYAKWELITYTITYVLDDGINNALNLSVYSIETEYTFLDATKEFYTLGGWYIDSEFKTKITNLDSNTGDITVYAKWDAVKYSITYELNDGTASNINEFSIDDISIKLNNPSKVSYEYGYWYLDLEFTNRISYLNVILLNIVDSTNITLYANYLNDTVELDIFDDEDSFGNTYSYLYFGEYPQTVELDEDIVEELNKLALENEDDVIFSYNGNKYQKQIANTINTDLTFLDGTKVTPKATYYFKIEPIKWRVLQQDGVIQVISEFVLDSSVFIENPVNRVIDGQIIYPNNYEYSDLREYLNNDFYNNAFSDLQKSFIETSFVDNTTNNVYSCNDTYDKMFLLSYDDVTNPDFGFSSITSSTESRVTLGTDFALALGGSVLSYGAVWCTRTPYYGYYDEDVYSIATRGSIGYELGRSDMGIRPSFTFHTL